MTTATVSAAPWEEGEHPRGPDGTFIDRPRAEPDVGYVDSGMDLWTDEGSYDFPPEPRNAEELVTFWGSVPITDTAIAHFVQAATGHREKMLDAAHARFLTATPEPTDTALLRKGGPEYQARVAEWEAARQAATDAAWNDRPLPSQSQWRAALRITQMFRHSQSLPTEERDKVLRMKVQVPGGDYAPVHRHVKRWHLDELPGSAFVDPASDPKPMADVIQKLRGVGVAVQNVRHAVEDSYTRGIGKPW